MRKERSPEIKRLEKANAAIQHFQAAVPRNVPDNALNKLIGSLHQGSVESFEIAATRYRKTRAGIHAVQQYDLELRRKNPKATSFKAHPYDGYLHSAIRVDVESLFIFGVIIARRTLPIIKLFLPDTPAKKVFGDLHEFYTWLYDPAKGHSPLAEKLGSQLRPHLRWLHTVLRFYRNAFIEHLDEPRQQGTILDFSGGRSRLSAYKWGFDSNDEAAIKDFKKRMLAKGINLPQEVRPRHYVQLLFDHISEVPDDLIKDALGLVEHIGIDSPEPEDLIEGVDGYLTFLFGFMEANLSDSRLSKC